MHGEIVMPTNDLDDVIKNWNETAMRINRPRLADAADIIVKLVIEIEELRKELLYQSKRQDLKEQQLKTMFVELHNVVQKHGNEIA